MTNRASTTNTRKKILAFALVAASIAMLFLPWLSISVKVLGRNYSIPDLLNMAVGISGYTRDEFQEEFFYAMDDLSDFLSEINVNYSPYELVNTVKPLTDGKLSPVELASVTMKIGSLLNKMNTGLAREDDYFTIETAKQIASYGSRLIAVSLVLWVLILGIFACAVLTFVGYNRPVGSKALIVFSSLVLVLFLLFGVLNLSANAVVRNFGETVSDILDELFNISYVLGAFNINNLFHLGLWPVLALIFALGALLLRFYPVFSGTITKIITLIMRRKKSVSNWICPSCGTELSEEFTFCYKCSAKRPAVKRCPFDGMVLPADAKYCPMCGAEGITPQLSDNFCPMCGAKNSEDATVCCRCNYTFADAGTNNSPGLFGTLLK